MSNVGQDNTKFRMHSLVFNISSDIARLFSFRMTRIKSIAYIRPQTCCPQKTRGSDKINL